MSFSYWWMSAFLTPEDVAHFAPGYAEAAERAVLSADSEGALRSWRANPDSVVETRDRRSSGQALEQQVAHYNRFIRAFNLPGFDALGVEMANFLGEESCYRFISIRRCSPGALLWHAIGNGRASRLPGSFGNVFLRAEEVDNALQQTDDALRGLVLDAAVDRGMALAGHSNDEQDVRDVIELLPGGLRRAQALGKGFMAIARPQL